MTGAAPPTLPAGFRPGTATDAELVKYGFPPRPAPAASARLTRLWNETFGRDVDWAFARFAPAANFPSRPCRRVIDGGDTSGTWSGVVVSAKPGEPFSLAIVANWNVPQLTAADAGTDWISIWVGLDGYV